MLYSHPIGVYGHGAGPSIGMYDNQGFVPGHGEEIMHDDTCYALELNVTEQVPNGIPRMSALCWRKRLPSPAVKPILWTTAAGPSSPSDRRIQTDLLSGSEGFCVRCKNKNEPRVPLPAGRSFSAVSKADVGNVADEMQKRGVDMLSWADPLCRTPSCRNT